MEELSLNRCFKIAFGMMGLVALFGSLQKSHALVIAVLCFVAFDVIPWNQDKNDNRSNRSY